jgi:hypothetical protein
VLIKIYEWARGLLMGRGVGVVYLKLLIKIYYWTRGLLIARGVGVV